MMFEEYDKTDMDEIRRMFAGRRRWIIGMVVAATLGYVAMVIHVVLR